ncbi:MAG: hypothetical protein RLZZ241_2088 [Bacteroidota bacterium]|jgi:hypothetical protein
MKAGLKFSLLAVVFSMLTSCTSVRVVADYDTATDFKAYKNYAFYKTGIDKAEISDLDKKRILRSIESELNLKGYQKSETPDLLVSIFTTERERINVYNNLGWSAGWGYGWGWGWSPWAWGGAWNRPVVSSQIEGSLYIDLIDAKSKELIWQGKGSGVLLQTGQVEKREARIQEFVAQILSKFPPGQTP